MGRDEEKTDQGGLGKVKILKIENLKVSVEGRQILGGVSMEIGAGQAVAIMGPNGSGKSTLALTLAGHPKCQITGGRVGYFPDGARLDLLKLKPWERARKGVFLAFQNPVEVEGVSALAFLWRAVGAIRGRDRVTFVGRAGTEEKKALRRIEENMTSFGEFRDRLGIYCGRLGLSEDFLKRGLNVGFSGGERKKFEVLQMMALAPRLVILDEIDSGTDVDAMRGIALAIKEYLDEEKAAAVIITHYNRILKYLPVAAVHVLKAGRIVKSGGVGLADGIERFGFDKARG